MTRLVFGATKVEISAERQRRILAAWPLHRQLEAHSEATAGRPEKLQALQADIAAIRAALPYPEESH